MGAGCRDRLESNAKEVGAPMLLNTFGGHDRLSRGAAGMSCLEVRVKAFWCIDKWSSCLRRI